MDYDYLKKIIRETISEEIKKENKALFDSLLKEKKDNAQPLPERTHLTAKELIATYGISDRTLINWQHSGLKPERVGRKKYFKITQVQQFLKSNTDSF